MLVILLIFIHLFTFCENMSSESLYPSNNPDNLVLNKDNFKSTLFGKNKAFIMQFYNSWCGHCIHFAPIWSKFAQDLSKWSPMVRVGTVNCADEKNLDICKNYGVQAFPTVRFFANDVKEGDKGLNYEAIAASNITAVKYKFIDFLVNITKKELPDGWVDLLPLEYYAKSRFIRNMPFTKYKHIFILVEKRGSYVGKELVLDFLKYSGRVFITRIESSNDFLLQNILAHSYSSRELPFLVEVRSDHSIKILNVEAHKTEGDKVPMDSSIFRRYIKDNYLNESEKTIPIPKKIEIEQTSLVEKVHEVHMNDLYAALRYTLLQEIPLKGTLNFMELEVLKRYLTVIDQHFPFDSSKARRLIKLVKRFVSTKVHDMETAEMVALIYSLAPDAALPEPKPYITCRSSKPGLRGHPCSMWLLFHTLTVHEYHKEWKPRKWSNVHNVMYTIRDYVSTFFSCTKCKMNFIEMSSELESKLIHQNSSVLWLWGAHNSVNKRLAGDLTEDPQNPKVQYPTEYVCRKCFQTNGNYSEKEVLVYLLNHYHEDEIVIDQVIVEDAVEGSEGEFNTQKTTFFSQTDMNLGMVLYVVSIAILLALFFIIRSKRRKRRYRKLFDLSA